MEDAFLCVMWKMFVQQRHCCVLTAFKQIGKFGLGGFPNDTFEHGTFDERNIKFHGNRNNTLVVVALGSNKDTVRHIKAICHGNIVDNCFGF